MSWPTEQIDGSRITATLWNAIVRALSTWQGNVNAGGFDLNNAGAIHATSLNGPLGLAGDVTGTSAAAVVAAVGGKLSAAVAGAVDAVAAATDAKMASVLVKRNASGDIAVGTLKTADGILFADNTRQTTAATGGSGGGSATTAGATPPTGGSDGDEYFEPPYLWTRQGGVWAPYGPCHAIAAVPSSQGFDWIGNTQGVPAVLVSTTGALEVSQPVDAGFRSRLLVKDVPGGTGAKTLIAVAAPSLVNSGAHRFGLVVYNAATGKGFCFVNLRNTAWEAFRFTGEVYTIQQFNLANQAIGMGPLWWRLVWTPGTSFAFAVSADGKNYIDLATETEGDHVGTPSKWGFFHSPQDAEYPMGYTVYSVLES